MPFLMDEDTIPSTISPGIAPEPERDPSFFGEVIPAAFRLSNTVGSLAAGGVEKDRFVDDPTFDPIALIPAGYEDHAKEYAFADSQADVDAITSRVDKERGDRETIAAGGALGVVASMAAGILDPINLIPFGGAAYRTAKVGKSILHGAGVTAWAAAAGATAQEAALHASQLTRTYGESAVNIAGATVVGGVLGGAFGGVIAAKGQKEIDRLAQLVEKDFEYPPVPGAADVGGSAGAKLSRDTSLEDEGVGGGIVARSASKILAFAGPSTRMLESKSISARRFAQDMADTSVILGKNEIGEATPRSVETLARNWKANLYRGLKGMDEIYSEYVFERSSKIGDVIRSGVERKLAPGGEVAKKMTYRDFRIEVGKAMRRGDEHPMPEVAKAAKMMRKEVFDPLKDEMIENKLLPEGVTPETAASYLMRLYKKEKLADPVERKRIIDVGVAHMLRRQASGVDAKDIGLTELDYVDTMQRLIQRIEGTPGGRLSYDNATIETGGGSVGGGTAAPLHKRAWDIDDLEIEDWLESDIEIVARRYVDTLAPDVELLKKFGDVELEKARKEIASDYEALIRDQKIDPKSKKHDNLIKRQERDIRDLLAMRDRIKGTYGMPDDPTAWMPRAGRVLHQLTTLSSMGGVVAASIPDLARPVMVHGFGKVFSGALKPMISSFKDFKAAKDDILDIGGAIDFVMAGRPAAWDNVGDEFGRGSRIERGMAAATGSFGLVSLMAPWNASVKAFAGVATQTRVIKAIEQDVAGTIGTKEGAYLRSIGISLDDSKKIIEQLNMHGGEENGSRSSNWIEWENKEARVAFQSALTREINRIIVTPGQEIPLMATGGPLGRLAFQFKSYAIASAQRVLLSGLQQSDMAMLNGLWLATSLGMVSYVVKSALADRPLSDDPSKWILEGVDRSGVTGWAFDVNNTIEKISRGTVGIGPALGVQPMSRYADREWFGSLFGPAIGKVGGVAKSVSAGFGAALGDDQWRASNTHALKMAMPYQNVIWLGKATRSAEENLNRLFGVQ